ncbi:aldehyde reductase II [Teratosphaeria destructans]|uniref:Aldehyde reductase II n=1 Tax=Teratosphaeria destructans TaxID=418781 RepID=A0A9W7W1U7_9PEZI|nr:aldehyde reductase II [Teratosphaeria destructans]
MPLRFVERMQRQYAACEAVFGQRSIDPPPYDDHCRLNSPCSSGLAPSFFSRYNRRSQDLPTTPPPPRSCPTDPSGAVDLDAFALPTQSLILVTGANGWLGMHVVDQLLEHGYRVRGTVRNAEKAISTGKYFGENGDATIAGALNALESAAKESGVKRFVYCSAAAAAVSEELRTINEVTGESWNMAAFEKAWNDAPPYDDLERALAVFAGSKMQAELAVWRWYRNLKAHFVLNTVLPGTLLGEVLDPVHQGCRNCTSELKSRVDENGRLDARSMSADFVDVQDSALLHVAALILPDVENQRIFAVSRSSSLDSERRLMGQLCSNRSFKSNCSDQIGGATIFRDAPKAEALLRRLGRKGWTDIETSVSQSRESLMTATQICQGG